MLRDGDCDIVDFFYTYLLIICILRTYLTVFSRWPYFAHFRRHCDIFCTNYVCKYYNSSSDEYCSHSNWSEIQPFVLTYVIVLPTFVHIYFIFSSSTYTYIVFHRSIKCLMFSFFAIRASFWYTHIHIIIHIYLPTYLYNFSFSYFCIFQHITCDEWWLLWQESVFIRLLSLITFPGCESVQIFLLI